MQLPQKKFGFGAGATSLHAERRHLQHVVCPVARVRAGDNNLTLEVPNEFCEVWLKDNYMGLLQDVLPSPPAANCR